MKQEFKVVFTISDKDTTITTWAVKHALEAMIVSNSKNIIVEVT